MPVWTLNSLGHKDPIQTDIEKGINVETFDLDRKAGRNEDYERELF